MLNMYTHTGYIPDGIRIVKSNDLEFNFRGAIIEDSDIIRKALREVEQTEYLDSNRFI